MSERSHTVSTGCSTQLRLAGKLRAAAGIVFGECKDCNYDDLQPSRVWDPTLGEVLNQAVADLNIPVYYGLTIGHTADQLTLPEGIMLEMDADKCVIKIEEGCVTE